MQSVQSVLKPPAAVKQAIANFQSIGPFKVIPPTENETSYIFKWGVRVEYRDENNKLTVRWACLADETCRTSGENLFRMSTGKTSRAAHHLRLVHNLASPKTDVEVTGKRKRDCEIDKLRASPLYANNPTRLNLLLETLKIVNHNLPLRSGEYEESKMLKALVVKKEMQTDLSSKRVSSAIVELYRSTKAEMMEYLADNREVYPNFTLVADFWTCKTTNDKYLGLRVYLVDKDWQFKSVLLGTKPFNPAYSEREGGIQKPFRMWLASSLDDFDLKPKHFFGATSDAGSDVKFMLRSSLQLRWEWCFAHMAHAATKMSCGLGGRRSKEANPEMASLITKMTTVITNVKLVSSAGDLFGELCKEKTKGASKRLIGHSASRFLSTTNAMRRVLDKWEAVVEWYKIRADRAIQERRPPPDFPLENCHSELVQILSLLAPVADLKFKCQAERPEQVEVLMSLYMIRIDNLCPGQPILHYLSTDEKPQWIPASSLTPLATKTRDLLREALDERFFARYYKDSMFDKCDFVLEMMLKLHPIFKNTQESLNRAVIMCCRQHGLKGKEAVSRLNAVNDKIRSNLLSLLKKVAGPLDGVAGQVNASSPQLSRLEARFAPRTMPVVAPRVDKRAEDELDRWMDDMVDVERNSNMVPKETVLEFWKRLEHSGQYRIIPKAVRVLFSIPVSSCQIERDFSVSGEMVSVQRTSLSGDTIDMGIFINRNPDFVNLLQCEEIPRGQHRFHKPSNLLLDIDPDLYMDDINPDILAEFVSSTSISREFNEEEEKSAM